MMKRLTVIAAGFLAAAAAAAYLAERADAPPLRRTYVSQEECERETARECSFWLCDVIPAGSTFEKTCGEDFIPGWQPR